MKNRAYQSVKASNNTKAAAPSNFVPLTVSVDRALLENLREQARRDECSLSLVVRRLFRKALET